MIKPAFAFTTVLLTTALFTGDAAAQQKRIGGQRHNHHREDAKRNRTPVTAIGERAAERHADQRSESNAELEQTDRSARRAGDRRDRRRLGQPLRPARPSLNGREP